MDSNKSITAHFKELPRYTLTVKLSGGGSSTVSVSPSQSTYYQGQTVTITAHPASGYVFSYWSDDYIGTGSSITVTTNSDMTITANFRRTS
jgi:hypothetical protein